MMTRRKKTKPLTPKVKAIACEPAIECFGPSAVNYLEGLGVFSRGQTYTKQDVGEGKFNEALQRIASPGIDGLRVIEIKKEV